MPNSLQQKVHQTARRARRQVRLHGVSSFVAMVGLVATAVGVADYLVRFEDMGVRLICSAVFGAAVVAGFLRFIMTSWRYRCSDLRAAHRIEGYFPVLGDRLSNAVAFANDTCADELAGSVELRRAVIAQTQAMAESLDFDRCLDRRRARRALLLAVAAIAVIALLGLGNGPAVTLAAKRLLIPWGSERWPRRHVLALTDAPTRLAVGQDFKVALVDTRGHLPDRVEIHYWFEGDDESRIQTQAMQPMGHQVTHRLINVTRPFRYRATGGDDDKMPWIELTLVEPPKIAEMEILLQPPEYTGLEERPADGSFRAWVGTRVSFRARTSQPLSAASLETNTMDGADSLSLPLDPDRRGFSLNLAANDRWVVAQSGFYGFRLIDQEGLDCGLCDQWEVEAMRDLPPTVSLKRPATDLLVTARAELPVEAIAKDDLALRSVTLCYQRSAASDKPEETIELWQGPITVAAESAGEPLPRDEGVHLTIEHSWDLTLLPSMKPGEWIEFRVVAEDYHAQLGESIARRVTIITPEELVQRSAQRQAELLSRMAEILRLQQDTCSEIADLEIKRRETGQLDRHDLDRLQVAELNQRQVRQRLGHPGDGVGAQIDELMQELKINRIDSPDHLERLGTFRDTIRQVNETQLPPIEHELIDALRIARESILAQPSLPPTDDQARHELGDLLQRVGAGQRTVIESLEVLLGKFAQWDNYQRLAREVGRLKRQQEDVRDATQQLRLETLTKEANDLTADQRTSLKRLSERQNEIALRFNSLTSSMELTHQKLLDDEPAAAATLADALEMARQAGIAGLMRDVREALERNRIGSATDQQGETIQLLEALQDVLANRRQYQLDRQVQQLLGAAAQLAQVRSRHAAIRQQLEDAQTPTADQLQRWGTEEAEMAQQVSQLARQAAQLQTPAAVQPLQQASQHLAQASQAGAANHSSAMRQAADQAQQSLDEALQGLHAACEQSQRDLRDERIARLRQTVSEFLSRQQRIIDETQQIAAQPPDVPEQATSDAAGEIDALAGAQAALGVETLELAATLSDAETFAFALRQAAEAMKTASGLLTARTNHDVALQSQGRAATLLQQILQAMMQQIGREPTPDEQPSEPQPPPDDQQSQTKYLLEQLTLIRALQLHVNEQTEALERQHGPWDQTRVSRQQELVQQQRQLAELVLQLLDEGSKEPAADRLQPPGGELDSLDRIWGDDTQLE